MIDVVAEPIVLHVHFIGASEPYERVLCQICEPRWLEHFDNIGLFHDYIADADPSRVECDGCVLS